MALPATFDFTGAAGDLPNPPWGDATNIWRPVFDGSGHGKINFTGLNGAKTWNADTFPNDQYAQLQFAWTPGSTSGNYVEIWCRSTIVSGSIDTGYLGFSDGFSDTGISRLTGGSETVIASANSTVMTSGDVLKLECVGNTITLYKNGVELCHATDSTYASGLVEAGGFDSTGAVLFDNFEAGDASGGGGGAGTHTLSGVGSVAISSPTWLIVSVSGITGAFRSGQANPPNWYHLGMFRWGTDNGVVAAHPVTGEDEIIEIPSGMTVLWYEIDSRLTMTVTESSSP